PGRARAWCTRLDRRRHGSSAGAGRPAARARCAFHRHPQHEPGTDPPRRRRQPAGTGRVRHRQRGLRRAGCRRQHAQAVPRRHLWPRPHPRPARGAAGVRSAVRGGRHHCRLAAGMAGRRLQRCRHRRRTLPARPVPGSDATERRRVPPGLHGPRMMKITRLTTYHAAPRWLFLKVETDEGITGWGEPVVEGRARTVEAAVHELGEYVVGKDPSRINDLWQTLYRGGFYRGGPVLMSAIAGIDQALWDIKGKALGVPVYELLGGRVRDRMKTYRWVGGDRPADLVEQIRGYRELGFDTFKFNGTEELKLLDSPRAVDQAVAKVAAVREAFGDSVDFGVDFHGRVGAPMAKLLLRELEPFKPLFIEEPVLPEQAEHYPRLAASTSIPLAAGERMYSRFEFKRVLEAGGLAILQPDLSHAGGITE